MHYINNSSLISLSLWFSSLLQSKKKLNTHVWEPQIPTPNFEKPTWVEQPLSKTTVILYHFSLMTAQEHQYSPIAYKHMYLRLWWIWIMERFVWTYIYIVEFGLICSSEKFANFFESHWKRFDLSMKSMPSLDNDAKFALWKSVAVYSWFDTSLVPLTGVRI